MRLIELTYYRSHKKYGSLSGPTSKKFFMNPLQISQLTEYGDCVKLILENGTELEVVETKEDIIRKANKPRQPLVR